MKLGTDGKWVRPNKTRSRTRDQRVGRRRRDPWYARREPKTVTYAAKTAGKPTDDR